MTNMQLLLAVLMPTIVPTVAVLIGIFINLSGNARLENRLNIVEGDLRRFYEILGAHGEAIETLKKRA
jgi:hypothetical protein